MIKSKASLTYWKAQDIHDDSNDNSELAKGIWGLMQIARVLRDRRVESGALTLGSPEVKFDMDENKNPQSVKIYETIDTNWLVEEFMLLANVYVAIKIKDHFPAYAVLRWHDSPKPKEMAEFQSLLEKYGYSIHLENSKSFADSLDAATWISDP